MTPLTIPTQDMDICGVRAATLGQDQGHGDGREIKNSVPTSSRTWVQEHQPVLGVAELLGIGEAGWGAVTPSMHAAVSP